MNLQAYTLRSGPSKGEVRPCVVTRVNADKTLDVSVFLAHGDGLSNSGMLLVRSVRPDYLGKDETSAKANAAASIRRELEDAVNAAEQAQELATLAREQATRAGDNVSKAQADALRLEAAAKAAKEKLVQLNASAVDLDAAAREQDQQAQAAVKAVQQQVETAKPLTGDLDKSEPEPGDSEQEETEDETPTEVSAGDEGGKPAKKNGKKGK